MPGVEPKTPAREGVSADAGTDVTALVEKLREELAGGANGTQGGRSRLLAARHRAERVWAVTAERPLHRRPGLRGRAARLQRRRAEADRRRPRAARPPRAVARGSRSLADRARGAADQDGAAR